MQAISSAAERNKKPILNHLTQWLDGDEKLLEIGSGSGQHALYFSQHLPNLHWQCSEVADSIETLQSNLNTASDRLPAAITLDVSHPHWNKLGRRYDVIFTANTLHIMNDDQVKQFLQQAPHALHAGGKIIIYGPFNYDRQYTSDSNKQFDQMLRQRNVGSCIKSFETIDAILQQHGQLAQDIDMPANNRLLVWELTKK